MLRKVVRIYHDSTNIRVVINGKEIIKIWCSEFKYKSILLNSIEGMFRLFYKVELYNEY